MPQNSKLKAVYLEKWFNLLQGLVSPKYLYYDFFYQMTLSYQLCLIFLKWGLYLRALITPVYFVWSFKICEVIC